MKALALLALLLTLAVPAAAKELRLTSAWSGIWSDETGQHRCALIVQDAYDPTRLTIVCQLGRSGGFADISPLPPNGWETLLDQPYAEFGTPPAGQRTWGWLSWFPYCDDEGPALHTGAVGGSGQARFELRPLTLLQPSKLCAGGAQIGGGR